MCGRCRYQDFDSNNKPCNTCIIWDDRYLRYRNFEIYDSSKRFSCDDFEDEL